MMIWIWGDRVEIEGIFYKFVVESGEKERR